MSKEACALFKGIDDVLDVKWNGSTLSFQKSPTLNSYCPISNDGNNQQCNTYEETISSAFLTLIVSFTSIDDVVNIENDKLVQYAILWLCYKLNQRSENGTSNINDFHTKYIKNVEKYFNGKHNLDAYNSYKDLINKKDDLMNINIISNIYEAFENLCKMHTTCNENDQNCSKCSKDANDFVESFRKLNEDSRIIGNNSYIEILSNLFNDYDDFKNGCAKKCSKCSDIPTLIYIKVPQSSVQDQAESSGVTSSSSSIAKTLIPVLSVFVAIPIFVGIAYKYSLFGFDKRLKRIHSKEKIKKIKKKMTSYV
ncbi:Plasmodium variant antigen protein Cir/Yir/Bir, putative [Plasmodium chabaudi adami]|uniref:Plasmodium variant antigen protein Cir/Yir/Bir, putative n=1 Tax=Plasmodium chabaudi adami TaxID=5826 RepID=A0A1D3L7X8_PLACE|nr:Plasmodium variant antigen protein Cir/Yir/Bir, putative [Plasmodium chabaudi adami]